MYENISLDFSWNEKCFKQNLYRKPKQHTHCMFSNFFPPESCAVCEMWINFVQPGRLHMTTRRMRLACSVTKATDRHSE